MALENIANFPPLISAMSKPEFYPDLPPSSELKQTHISYVFLAGAYAYKVKKPVRFSFLDYSTLAKRHHFCREEVRLNRRLAPQVYLGVLPIYQRKNGFLLGENAAGSDLRPSEYTVKMIRLPEERMLSRLVAGAGVSREEFRAIAEKLVSFHHSAAADRAATYGAPEAVRRQITENFDETGPFVGQTLSAKMLQRARAYCLSFLETQQELFQARIRNGRVREGHGDLRAEHICLTDGIPIFDCVEFSEAFRYGDVASELAFLAMDLDFLDGSDLADDLALEYTRVAQDEALSRLLPFYKCYRAYVRGKVESLKGQEREVPERERKTAWTRAERYFFLADRYVRGMPRPAMLIVCGLVATGKSTVARMLRDLTGFRVLSSDVIRKGLAHRSPTESVRAGYRKGIYSDSFTRLTYEKLLEEAERSWKAGKGVIVDATFKDPANRRLFLSRAAASGVAAFFIECQASEPELLRRLQEREKNGAQTSDATREVYLQQRAEFVPLTELPDRVHLSVNTEAGLRDSIENLLETLRSFS